MGSEATYGACECAGVCGGITEVGGVGGGVEEAYLDAGAFVLNLSAFEVELHNDAGKSRGFDVRIGNSVCVSRMRVKVQGLRADAALVLELDILGHGLEAVISVVLASGCEAREWAGGKERGYNGFGKERAEFSSLSGDILNGISVW